MEINSSKNVPWITITQLWNKQKKLQYSSYKIVRATIMQPKVAFADQAYLQAEISVIFFQCKSKKRKKAKGHVVKMTCVFLRANTRDPSKPRKARCTLSVNRERTNVCLVYFKQKLGELAQWRR